jgi:hypothetical protein
LILHAFLATPVEMVPGLAMNYDLLSCGSRKPAATINPQVCAHVITPLAARSDDATHPLLGLPRSSQSPAVDRPWHRTIHLGPAGAFEQKYTVSI